MSKITTHVLDTALGRPAQGIDVLLEDSQARLLAQGTTDSDGRVSELGPSEIDPGVYRLRFFTGPYLSKSQSASSHEPNSAFYPEVTVTFTVVDDGSHYHVPLLLSPFGYSTYRGS